LSYRDIPPFSRWKAMILSRCSGDAKEKIFLNAMVFRGMDSTMTPSKSRMRVVRGFVGYYIIYTHDVKSCSMIIFSLYLRR
jgi:hypothetical protein